MMMMSIGAAIRVTFMYTWIFFYCTNGNLRNETRRSQKYMMDDVF